MKMFSSTSFVWTLILSIFLFSAMQCRPTERNPNNFGKFGIKAFTRTRRFNMELTDKTSSPPQLQIKRSPGKTVQISEGEPLVLECEAASNPPAKVFWMKDGKRIEKFLEGNDDLIRTPKQLGLSLTKGKFVSLCADQTDNGVYACIAENSYYREVSETVVKVKKDPAKQQQCLQKRFVVENPQVTIVMNTNTLLEYIGESAQLYCRGSGDGVRYRWFGPAEKEIDQNNGRFVILESGDLIIKNLTWEDMGGYVCEVSNGLTSDRTSTFLYPTLPDDVE